MPDAKQQPSMTATIILGAVGSIVASVIIAVFLKLSTDAQDWIIGAIVAVLVFVAMIILANRTIVAKLETGNYPLWYSFVFLPTYPLVVTGLCLLAVWGATALAAFIRA